MFSMVYIYSPNNETVRNTFYKTMSDLIQTNTDVQIIIGGDFNDVLYSIDRVTSSLNRKTNQCRMSLLLYILSLSDIWQIINPNSLRGKGKTVWKKVG